MNSKIMKKIRRRAKELLLEWMQSLVDKEAAKMYTIDNVLNYSPRQTHLYYNDGSFHLSSYTFKLIYNMIMLKNIFIIHVMF